MNYYNIDFRELANKLTPPFLRSLKNIDFLEAILKPLEEVNLKFKSFRRSSIYKVKNNGQIVYLQAVLNDTYDNSQRRIYILDFPIFNPVYVFPVNDQKPVYLDSKYLHTEAEVNAVLQSDFLVFVPLEIRPYAPEDLEIFLTQIKSLVNYYKLASKRFDIKFI